MANKQENDFGEYQKVVEIFDKMRAAIPDNAIAIDIVEASKMLIADCLTQSSMDRGERAVFLIGLAGEIRTLCNMVENRIKQNNSKVE